MRKKFSLITRILSAIMALTLMMSICCVSAFALSSDTYSNGATVSINGETKHYDSIEKAWNAATNSDNCYKNVVVTLYQDWVANKGSFGSGRGFTEQGGMIIKCMLTSFTLDLNGHSIDRKATKDDSFDSIIYTDHDSNVIITDSTCSGKSEIKGGSAYNYGGAIKACSKVFISNITFKDNYSHKKGGAIYAYSHIEGACNLFHGDVVIENCKFTSNSCGNSGGAIFVDSDSSCAIYDSEITNNTAKKDGGAINCEIFGLFTAKFKVGGKVIIKDNTVNGKANNLCLDENTCVKATVSFDSKRPLSDDSYISLYSKTGDKTLRITENSSSTHINNFNYERSNYVLVEKGSADKQYLDIKKV